MSGLESPGITLAPCRADIVELVAFRERAPDLERLAAASGQRLPALGAIAAADGQAALAVRPARWLALSSPQDPGSRAALWQETLRGAGAAVDLSAALAAFFLGGPAVRTMLVRACRLDLSPEAFPAGGAAATIMVQVPVTLAALGAEILLLTPATTARHLREWLAETSKPFGLEYEGDRSI